MWHYLFQPSFFLQQQVRNAREHMGLRDGQPYIGIHFRAGNESRWWDPDRHPLDSIRQFLACAKTIEYEMFGEGLAAELGVKWFLSSDTARVLAVPEVASLISIDEDEQGNFIGVNFENSKLIYISDNAVPDKVGHIDRSKIDGVINGASLAYVSYTLLQEATAVVLSRSFFGETAAETGHSGTNAYFYDGCWKMDLSSS